MGPIVAVSVSVTASVAGPVSVTDLVQESGVRGPESGVRGPGSGVRLLRRDQVNPVTVSDSVSVTGSDASRAAPSHFHASRHGSWSMG